jgi:ribosome-associated protein
MSETPEERPGVVQATDSILIPETELAFSFIRASGPGGQNVNKVASAVQLRFDAAASPSLPDDVRERLLRLAGTRVTADGIVVIEARRFRSQHRNREDAVERLVRLIRRAAEKPKKRRKTRPTRASVERRLEDKQRRSRVKNSRRPVKEE